MSKRALWLAYSALSVGFIVVSCNSSDGGTEGDGAGDAGDTSSAGSNGSGEAAGGSAPSEAGSPGSEAGTGGSETNGGRPGAAGEGSGGAPPIVGGASGEGGAAGSGLVEGAACDSYEDCEKGEHCRKADCSENAPGVCVAATRGTTPVCGYDGVTYYSGGLANEAGVAVRASGVCSAKLAVSCEAQKCPSGLTCGRVQLRGNSCLTKVPGVCWQLPKLCSKERAAYSLCDSDKCATLCQAVSSGEVATSGGLACAITLP